MQPYFLYKGEIIPGMSGFIFFMISTVVLNNEVMAYAVLCQKSHQCRAVYHIMYHILYIPLS